MKRTHKEIKKAILQILSDGLEHSYADLERKVNTNWISIRQHCEDLELFKAITIKDNKIKIAKIGRDILKKL